jgi:hypothetical protein
MRAAPSAVASAHAIALLQCVSRHHGVIHVLNTRASFFCAQESTARTHRVDWQARQPALIWHRLSSQHRIRCRKCNHCSASNKSLHDQCSNCAMQLTSPSPTNNLLQLHLKACPVSDKCWWICLPTEQPTNTHDRQTCSRQQAEQVTQDGIGNWAFTRMHP